MSENYALQLRHITKTFPGVKALNDVSFDVRYGTVHSIVGENGAGKSTLMKIINGMHMPNSGEILVNGEKQHITSPQIAKKLGISMIFQELVYAPNLSVAENLCLGDPPRTKAGFVDWKTMREQAEEILKIEHIHTTPNAMMYTVPISDAQMMEIVKATYHNAKIVIMDEPTSSLTQHESERLFDKIRRLKEEGCAVIYISHKMEEILRISDEVTIMRDGQYIGTWEANELTTDMIITKMVGRELSNLYPPRSNTPGEVVFEVKDFTSINPKSFRHVNFNVRKGEILGVAGLVGAQRTELMEGLFGLRCHTSGTITYKGKELTINQPQDAIKNGIAMLTEDRRATGILGVLSIADNVSIASLNKYLIGGIMLDDNKIEKLVQDNVAKLSIKTPSSKTQIQSLSGGNQQKVLIARWLANDPDVFIMDEPTRGIDVGAKYEIYCIIAEMAKQGKSIIMISSEMSELIGMSDRIMVMCDGRCTGFIDGDKANQENIMTLATQFE